MLSGEYDLYRYFNGNGSTKDWAVRANKDGTYTTRWGRTGTRLQSKTYKNMLPMQDHIRMKTNKGYKLIGTFFIDDEGQVSSVQHASHADEFCIYWRVKMKQTSLADTDEIGQFMLNAYYMAKTIQSFMPDHEWIKVFSEKIITNQLPLSGKLHKEFGVSSLLLFMGMMKISPSQIDIHLSHEDNVSISNMIKMESQALSLFDADLEAIRPIAEEIGLLEKRLDVSTIAYNLEGFYF